MSEQSVVQDGAAVVAEAGRAVTELAEVWAECKKLGCDIAHVIDAVEAGDAPAVIMAVIRECFPRKDKDGKVIRDATLPGQRPDIALRFARARRRQQGG